MQLAPLQKLSMSVGAALVVLGLFAATAFYYSSRLVAADHAVERANATIASAFRVVMGRQAGENAAKAYVVRGDTAARGSLQDAQESVEEALDAMARSSEDNPQQHTDVLELGKRVAANFDGFRATLLIRDHAGADSARRYLNGDLSAVASDSVVKLAGKIRDESLRVLAEQTRLQSAHGASAQRVILVGMVLTFLLAGIALQPMRSEVAARITSQLVREHHEAIPELAHDAADAASAAHARLQAMHRLVASLATVRDAAAGARTIVTSARDMLGVTLAAVIVPNGAGGFSVLAASHEGFDSVSPELASAVAATLRTGEPAMAESRAERTRQWGTLAALDTAGARGSVLFAPLTREAVANGVLIAALDDDRVFDDDVLSCAATLGRLGGPAVAARPLTS